MKKTVNCTESSELYRKISTLALSGTQRQETLAIVKKVEWLAYVLGQAVKALGPRGKQALRTAVKKGAFGNGNRPQRKMT